MLTILHAEFAYFFFHTWLRNTTIRQLSLRSPSSSSASTLSTSAELLVGAAAGALAQIFTIPVSVIATRQQLWSPASDTPSSKSLSLLETAREIVHEDGPTGLWTGLKPGLVLTVNPAITYGAFERIKSYILTSQINDCNIAAAGLSMTESFCVGVLSKAIATVVTYPYIFVS